MNLNNLVIMIYNIWMVGWMDGLMDAWIDKLMD
jgi:hypothetical protein